LAEGKFHLKLNRATIALGDLPAVAEADLVDAPGITRGDWQETCNEVKVQYPERIFSLALEITGPAPGNPAITYENDGHGIISYPGGVKTFVNNAVSHFAGRQHIFAGDSYLYLFLRFPEVSIVGGSVVDSATLYLSGSPTGAGSPLNRWYYCAELAPDAPVSYDTLLAKPLSSVYVDENLQANPKPGEYPGYEYIQDVTALISGAVNQSGWLRKNPIMLLTRPLAIEEYMRYNSFESDWPPFMEIWWSIA